MHPPAAPSTALIHPSLLDALLRAAGPLSLDDLAGRSGLRRTDLAAELERLAEAGCALQVHPMPGVTLVRSGLAAWPDYLRWALADGDGRVIEVYRQVGSTQDTLRRTIGARGPAARRAVVLADEQTAGRGRLGRRWVAPAGTCVLLSYAHVGAESADRLALAVAVAVARTMDVVGRPYGLSSAIKWPNDVVVRGRKLAGILIETPDPAAAIIGVGVNVGWTHRQLPADAGDLAANATSLALEGCVVDRLCVAAELVRQLDAALASPDPALLLAEWRRRSVLLDREVTLGADGRTVRGHVIDLDPADGLIVRTSEGTMVHLHAATTTVLA